MRIIILLFLFLSNFSTYVKSCPSSGDGDCVPSNNNYNKGSKEAITETSGKNTLSSSDNYENDGGLPDYHIAKSSNFVKKINEKSKLNSQITKLNFDLENIIYNSSKQYNSNFSNQINNKLYDINSLIIQNKIAINVIILLL